MGGHNGGRPKVKYKYRYSNRQTKLTEECVRKLEEAAAVRANDKQRCFYAGISRDTYYRWLRENPDLSDRLDDLYERLPLRARQNIAQKIEGQPTLGDIELSKWLLERTQEELTPKLKLSGSISEDSNAQIHPEDEVLYQEFIKKRREARQHRALEEDKKLSETKGAN